MSSQNDASSFSVLTDHVPSKSSRKWIHSTRGLVQEDSLAISAKCNGNTQFSFHSATKILRVSVSFLPQSNILNTRLDFFLGLLVSSFGIQSFDHCKELNVLLHSKNIEKTIMLQADTNLLTDFCHLSPNIFSCNNSITLRWRHHSGQQVQCGRFASSIVSQECSALSSVHGQVQSIDRNFLLKVLLQIANFDTLPFLSLIFQGSRNWFRMDSWILWNFIIACCAHCGAAREPIRHCKWKIKWQWASEFRRNHSICVPAQHCVQESIHQENCKSIHECKA
mmetsp:Transcript_31991/g.77684  ORF Transcript_31991/g.77684 Transcript_31991/m.77684 type:complete len:280 (-) Transcript_31991:733-1572(-)